MNFFLSRVLKYTYENSKPFGFLNHRAQWSVEKTDFDVYYLANGKRYSQIVYGVSIGDPWVTIGTPKVEAIFIPSHSFRHITQFST